MTVSVWPKSEKGFFNVILKFLKILGEKKKRLEKLENYKTVFKYMIYKD